MKPLLNRATSPLAAVVLCVSTVEHVSATDATRLIEGAGWTRSEDVKIQTEAEPLDAVSFQKQVRRPDGREASVTLVYQKDREIAWIGLKTPNIALLDGTLFGFSWTGNSRLLFSTETRKFAGDFEATLRTIDTDITKSFDLMLKERSFKLAFDQGGVSDKTRTFRTSSLKIENGNFVLTLVGNSAEKTPAVIVLNRDINYVKSSLKGVEANKNNVTVSPVLSARKAEELRSNPTRER